MQRSDNEVAAKESDKKSRKIADPGQLEHASISQDGNSEMNAVTATEGEHMLGKDKSTKKKEKSKEKSNKKKKESDDEVSDEEAGKRKRKEKDDDSKKSKRRKELSTLSEPTEKVDIAKEKLNRSVYFVISENNSPRSSAEHFLALRRESSVLDKEILGIESASTPPHGTTQQKTPTRGRRKEKVVAIGEQTSHLYPHRVKVYPENTDPRKIYKSRAIGVPRRPDFSVSDSDSDSDSDNEGTGPLNELHTKMVQYKANDVKKFESEGLPVKTGKWDVLENKILEKRLKKIARVRKRC
jgi:hypothetical protein